MPAKTHGQSRTKAYRAYIRMWHRCYNESDKDFRNYGARGITVCERWQGDDGFQHFLEDLGQPPSPDHSIERVNNDGNYEPGNVVWATKKQQSRNRKTNRMLEFCGRQQTLTAWAEEYAVPVKVLWRRLERGWSMGRALATPAVRKTLPRAA